MKATVTKQFGFESAHILPNHKGKCSRLHGHNYLVEVSVHDRVNDATGNTDEGMVVDFGDLKAVWEDHVKNRIDHRNLNEVLVDTGEIPVSTAEWIAIWIFKEFKERLPRITSVKVWETPNSYAEVSNGDLVYA
jgi:6-pyruvoyltetrahydropterin/6-carboxytetrahydropterin synthase